MKDIIDIKSELISMAKNRFGSIAPCGYKKTFDECFTEFNGTLFFWFNTTDDSSHLVSMDIRSA